jgi:hypothetical protein
MDTISDNMKTLSKDIKSVFEELIKLLIKKNLKTPVNPSVNTKSLCSASSSTSEGKIYVYKPKSERNDDVVSRFVFSMTNESLGWTGCVMVDFELITKSVSGPLTSDGKYSSIYASPKKRLAFTDSEFSASKRAENPDQRFKFKRTKQSDGQSCDRTGLDTRANDRSDGIGRFDERDFDREFDDPNTGVKALRRNFGKNDRHFQCSGPGRHDRNKSNSRNEIGSPHRFERPSFRPSPNTKFQGEKSIQDVLSSKKFQNSYISDLKYPFVFKMLEEIGRNIIDQTAPHITLDETLKMSTAQLRLKLNKLDQNLHDMREFEPEIFDDYVDMVMLINSVGKRELKPLINLVASLTYQKWDDMADDQKTYFEKNLSEDFLKGFHANNLITILLQSNNGEQILNCSQLYPLMKMLFSVFGYSKLVPNIIFENIDEQAEHKSRLSDNLLRDHDDGDDVSCYRRDCEGNGRRQDTESIGRRQDTESIGRRQDTESIGRRQDNEGADCGYDGNKRDDHSQKDDETYNGMRWNQMPKVIEPCVYHNIKIFGDLYPVIISLMGGTKDFPPEYMLLHCKDIADNYDMMTTLSEFLWRFNDYSYKEYMESLPDIQPNLTNKINNKIRTMSSRGAIGTHLY